MDYHERKDADETLRLCREALVSLQAEREKSKRLREAVREAEDLFLVAYQSMPRVAWEPGLTEVEARSRICAWLANRWAEMLPLPSAMKYRLLALREPLMRLELVGDMVSPPSPAR